VVHLPDQSAQQYSVTQHLPSSAAQPGDLIFFYSSISHVGMYIGNGQMTHSANGGSTVHVRAVNWGNVVGVGRPG
jgi:cell wall-associated NlpC family hydrolase